MPLRALHPQVTRAMPLERGMTLGELYQQLARAMPLGILQYEQHHHHVSRLQPGHAIRGHIVILARSARSSRS